MLAPLDIAPPAVAMPKREALHQQTSMLDVIAQCLYKAITEIPIVGCPPSLFCGANLVAFIAKQLGYGVARLVKI